MSGRAEPCTASLQPLRRSERAGRRLRSFRRSVVLCAPLHPAPPRPRLSWALLEPGLPLNSLTSWIRTIRAPPPSPCARSPAWGGELMPLIPLMPMIRAPPPLPSARLPSRTHFLRFLRTIRAPHPQRALARWRRECATTGAVAPPGSACGVGYGAAALRGVEESKSRGVGTAEITGGARWR
jgi:hypothetical protein